MPLKTMANLNTESFAKSAPEQISDHTQRKIPAEKRPNKSAETLNQLKVIRLVN